MRIRYADKTPVDFVVVGGGGAGAIVAKELSTGGFQVVILEQGPYLHENDFEHDELKFKDIWEPPGNIGQEILTNDHTLQPNTFRKNGRRKGLARHVCAVRAVHRGRDGALHGQLLALS
jgi:choline dehydrogenase-like flavoprotein